MLPSLAVPAVVWRVVAALLAGLVLAGTAAPASAAAPYPPPGRCVDTSGELGAPLCAAVDRILLGEEQSHGDEIAVAVVPTTGGAPIEAWATGLFNAWGVGNRGADNGVLLVVAVRDRRMRIVTGEGARQRLTDEAAAGIVTGTLQPEFAQGRIPAGVLAGLDEIRAALGYPPGRDTALARLATGAATPVDVAPPADALPDLTTTELPVGGFPPGAVEPGDGGAPSGGGTAVGVLLLGLVLAGIVVALARRGEGREASAPRSGGAGEAGSPSWMARFGEPRPPTGTPPSGPPPSGDGFGGGGSSGGGASGSW
jgi:uncharacterized protein